MRNYQRWPLVAMFGFQAAVGFFCWWGLAYNDLWADVWWAIGGGGGDADFAVALTLVLGPPVCLFVAFVMALVPARD